MPDDCADFAYTSHCLEHFYEQQARQLLQEAWRVLKPGGILRVCVPDLAHAMDLYQQGKKREALEYFFQSAEVDKLDRHKFMYDFALLSELLKSLGFQTVERCDYRKGRVPDLDILDNRPEQTLYVEAVK